MVSNIFDVHLYLGKMNPFWLAHIFQRGGEFNHQLVMVQQTAFLRCLHPTFPEAPDYDCFDASKPTLSFNRPEDPPVTKKGGRNFHDWVVSS